MTSPPGPILPYPPAPKRWHPRQITRGAWITTAILALVLLVRLAANVDLTNCQIRLDTGDLRYTWCKIPFKYRPTPEPLRSTILSLTSRIPGTTNTWATCGTGHKNPEYNPDLMCGRFYDCIAIWNAEDPAIAHWLMEDTLDYIQHAKGGLPRSASLLSTSLVNTTTRKINPAWRDDPAVQYFCTAHRPPPPPPTK